MWPPTRSRTRTCSAPEPRGGSWSARTFVASAEFARAARTTRHRAAVAVARIGRAVTRPSPRASRGGRSAGVARLNSGSSRQGGVSRSVAASRASLTGEAVAPRAPAARIPDRMVPSRRSRRQHFALHNATEEGNPRINISIRISHSARSRSLRNIRSPGICHCCG